MNHDAALRRLGAASYELGFLVGDNRAPVLESRLKVLHEAAKSVAEAAGVHAGTTAAVDHVKAAIDDLRIAQEAFLKTMLLTIRPIPLTRRLRRLLRKPEDSLNPTSDVPQAP